MDKLRELAHILLRGYPQPKKKNLSPTVLKRLPFPFHMLPSLKRHNYCLFFHKDMLILVLSISLIRNSIICVAFFKRDTSV